MINGMADEIEITDEDKYRRHVNWVATHQRPELAFNIVAEHVCDALRCYFSDVETEEDYDHSVMTEGPVWDAICRHINSFCLETQVAVIDGHPSYYDEYHVEQGGMSLKADLETTACLALRDEVGNRIVERDIIPVENW